MDMGLRRGARSCPGLWVLWPLGQKRISFPSHAWPDAHGPRAWIGLKQVIMDREDMAPGPPNGN